MSAAIPTYIDTKKSFDILDRKKKGFLTTAFLKRCLTTRGDKLTEEEFDNFMAKLDKDSDGKVTAQEWAGYFQNGIGSDFKDSDTVAAESKADHKDLNYALHADLMPAVHKGAHSEHKMKNTALHSEVMSAVHTDEKKVHTLLTTAMHSDLMVAASPKKKKEHDLLNTAMHSDLIAATNKESKQEHDKNIKVVNAELAKINVGGAPPTPSKVKKSVAPEAAESKVTPKKKVGGKKKTKKK